MTKSNAPKHAVIVAHPEPRSFTVSVANTYCDAVRSRGHIPVLRDLYRIGFDPVLKASERASVGKFEPAGDVAAELEQLAGAEIFVLVYPVWFGAPPAIIKGYIERVFGAGSAGPLRGTQLLPPRHPLLGGKRLLSITSSGATRDWLNEQGAWVSLQTLFDGYLARAFWMNTPDHLHFESVTEGLGESVVRDHLAKVEARAGQICDRLSRELA